MKKFINHEDDAYAIVLFLIIALGCTLGALI
jgi:hypothetical protein